MLSLLTTQKEHRFRNYFNIKINFILFDMRKREHIDR